MAIAARAYMQSDVINKNSSDPDEDRDKLEKATTYGGVKRR
jgi:hypothetical protein